MTGRRGSGPSDGDSRPQLQIWEDQDRATGIGVLSEGGREWELFVLLEPVASDLFRGRLSFRDGEERYDTAPVLVESSVEDLFRRAAELPSSVLRQLLVSARG